MNRTYDYYTTFEVSTYLDTTTPHILGDVVTVNRIIDRHKKADVVAVERILTDNYNAICGDDFVRITVKSINSMH